MTLASFSEYIFLFSLSLFIIIVRVYFLYTKEKGYKSNDQTNSLYGLISCLLFLDLCLQNL